ncbi:hypothetical protein AYO44_13175 [Planctomycetaceae bacterium SCGC AG-212-F19]|nr:hypothetical protein AYO44_13175 [Planctomycetaceae bacterium SCGC AG-212-F19]
MRETKRQIKERLQAAGIWEDYTALRDQLVKDGQTPGEARQEALRRIDSRPRRPNPQASPAKSKEESAEPVLVEQAEDELAVMQHVLTKPATKDRTYQQKNYRQWMAGDRRGFMARKTELEERKGGEKEPQEDEAGKVDEGSQRAIALGKQWLAQRAVQQAEEDAKLAARPGAAETGARLQKELREALERERQLRQRAEELEDRNGPVEENPDIAYAVKWMLFDSHKDAIEKDTTLAASPTPAELIGTLEKAVKHCEWRAERMRDRIKEQEQRPVKGSGKMASRGRG